MPEQTAHSDPREYEWHNAVHHHVIDAVAHDQWTDEGCGQGASEGVANPLIALPHPPDYDTGSHEHQERRSCGIDSDSAERREVPERRAIAKVSEQCRQRGSAEILMSTREVDDQLIDAEQRDAREHIPPRPPNQTPESLARPDHAEE